MGNSEGFQYVDAYSHVVGEADGVEVLGMHCQRPARTNSFPRAVSEGGIGYPSTAKGGRAGTCTNNSSPREMYLSPSTKVRKKPAGRENKAHLVEMSSGEHEN